MRKKKKVVASKSTDTEKPRWVSKAINDQKDFEEFVTGETFKKIVTAMGRKARLTLDESADVAQETLKVIFDKYVARKDPIPNEVGLACQIFRLKTYEVLRASRNRFRTNVSRDELLATLTAPVVPTVEATEEKLNVRLATTILPREDQALLFRKTLDLTLAQLSETTGKSKTELHYREKELRWQLKAELRHPSELTSRALRAQLAGNAVPMIEEMAPVLRATSSIILTSKVYVWPMDNHRLLVAPAVYAPDAGSEPRWNEPKTYAWYVTEPVYEPFKGPNTKLRWNSRRARDSEIPAPIDFLMGRYDSKSEFQREQREKARRSRDDLAFERNLPLPEHDWRRDSYGYFIVPSTLAFNQRILGRSDLFKPESSPTSV